MELGLGVQFCTKKITASGIGIRILNTCFHTSRDRESDIMRSVKELLVGYNDKLSAKAKGGTQLLFKFYN